MSFALWVALACAALPAASEEASFEERVRAYLLENPEVILEALEVLSRREAAEAARARIASFPELFNDAPRLTMGAEDAPIQIVEFFDYKCAPCKALHPALVDFVELNPNVRIEMRQLPILTPGSERAARFALAVYEAHGAEFYAKVHNVLWLLRGPLRLEEFEKIANDLGLEFATLEAGMASPEITQRIDYNRDAAIALEILGTPAFVTPTSVVFGTTDINALAETWLSQ